MKPTLRRCITAAFALFCVAQMVGCQSLPEKVRLYSEQRDKQGAAAKASWEKVDLDTMIATERSNLNKLLEVQLDLQEKYATANRDRKLRALLVSDLKVGDAMTLVLDKELGTLVGKGTVPGAVEAALRERQENAASASAVSLKMAALKFQQIQARMPTCKEFVFTPLPDEQVDITGPADLVALIERTQKDTTNPFKFDRLTAALKYLMTGCGDKADPYAKFRDFSGGALQDALQDKDQDDRDLADARATGQRLKEEFDESSKAYLAAIGAKPKAESTPLAMPASDDAGESDCVDHPATKLGPAQVDAMAAAHRLCKAILQIEKANNAFANKLLSEERLASLQKLVDTINQLKPGDPVPADASRLSKTYILLPGLVDEFKTAIDAKKKPAAMSLIIQRNLDELKQEGAVREIGLLESRAKLSQLSVDEMFVEADLLLKAKTNLNKNHRLIAMPMESAFTQAEADDKITLYSALTNYADAIGRQELKWRKARQQRLATFHEVALLYAEVNLKQWTSLIDTSVEQVGDSAAGGIKSENITNLLNTLGLFYIGRGANK